MPLIIRQMTDADIDAVIAAKGGRWWRYERAHWEMRLGEQADKTRLIIIAVESSEIVAYAHLIWNSRYEHFLTHGIPEISDLRVAESKRGQGIASKIINQMETLALEAGCKAIGLGVGLYADYGAAQRLYVRLGFVPDGNGVTYNYEPAIPGNNVRLDDELLLWLIKPLQL